MRKLNWFERRRFERAIATIKTKGEMSMHEVIDMVSPVNHQQLIFEMALAVSNKRVGVRYDRTVDGIFVESQTSFLDFPSDTRPEEIEIVYTKASV